MMVLPPSVYLNPQLTCLGKAIEAVVEGEVESIDHILGLGISQAPFHYCKPLPAELPCFYSKKSL
jgi:hypothetical protein